MAEDARPGTTSAAVAVSDPDPGRHGQIQSLRIESGDEGGAFVVERQGSGGFFLIRVSPMAVSRRLLRRGRRFSLGLVATDAGQPPRSSKATLEIRVEDGKQFRCEWFF